MGVKTQETELSHLSDEEYLIARSKQKRSSNPAACSQIPRTRRLELFGRRC